MILPAYRTIANSALWPITIVLVLHRVLIKALNGHETDDYTTVYSAIRRMIEGVPVYSENYASVEPHYLYNPGATLLLMPMGLSDNIQLSRILFIIINAAAIIAALALLTRLMGLPLTSPLFPGAISAAFLTESVNSTLVFANINGILLFLLVSFYALFLSTPKAKKWLRGIIIGVAILIKPMFAPLLLLPLVRLDWRTLIAGVATPALANLIAWPIVPGSSDYLTVVMPYLGQTRDYANVSLPGLATYFGIPSWLEISLWLLIAALVGLGLIALLPHRTSDPLFWAITTGSLLLTGVFLLSSLGQQYYSMSLFPLILTAVRPRSVFHLWPAWLAATIFLFGGEWHSQLAIHFGRYAMLTFPTIGWFMLVIIITVAALSWLPTDWWNKLSACSVATQHD